MPETFRTPGDSAAERDEFWIKKITEARAHPGGILQWCRENNILKETYYHWFKKLKNRIASWNEPLDTNKKRRKKELKISTKKLVLRSKKEWLDLVDACKRSGKKPSTFARENNLVKVTFCRWYRFSNSNFSSLKDMKRSRQTTKIENFVPVKIVEAPKNTLSAKTDSEALEVVLANGRKIRITGDFSPSLLKTVISTLEEC